MREISYVELFAGIGGFGIAAHRNDWTAVMMCEWDPSCQKTLRRQFPGVEIVGDIKNVKGEKYKGKVDVICGGFPCQPFSHAGQRKGATDDRYYWPETLRVITEIQPAIIFLENVGGLLTMEQPADITELERSTYYVQESINLYEATYHVEANLVIADIIRDIEKCGYEMPRHQDGTPIIFCVPACAINAPHRRDRIWIVAYARHDAAGATRNSGADERGRVATVHPAQPGRNWQAVFDFGYGDIPRAGADTNSIRTGSTDHKAKRERTETEQISQIRPRVEPIHNGSDATASTAAANTSGVPIEKGNGKRGKLGQKRKQVGSEPITDGNKQPDTHTENERLQGRATPGHVKEKRTGRNQQFGRFRERTDWEHFPTQSPICRRNDGFPEGLDTAYVARIVQRYYSIHRHEKIEIKEIEKAIKKQYGKWYENTIKQYGNAIVPDVAEQFCKMITEFLQTY